MKIEIEDSAVITIEGMKFSGGSIKGALNHPPTDCLFSVRKDGDYFVFTSYYDVEACKKFFAPNDDPLGLDKIKT